MAVCRIKNIGALDLAWQAGKLAWLMPNAAEITHAVDVAVLATDSQPFPAGACSRVAVESSTCRQRVCALPGNCCPAERPSTTTAAPGPIITERPGAAHVTEERLELV